MKDPKKVRSALYWEDVPSWQKERERQREQLEELEEEGLEDIGLEPEELLEEEGSLLDPVPLDAPRHRRRLAPYRGSKRIAAVAYLYSDNVFCPSCFLHVLGDEQDVSSVEEVAEEDVFADRCGGCNEFLSMDARKRPRKWKQQTWPRAVRKRRRRY